MVSDLISWAFHSPRRLALLIVAVLTVLLAGASLLNRMSAASAPAAVGATTQAAAPAPAPRTSITFQAGPTGSPSQASVPDGAQFVAAAVRFTQQWSALRPGETAAQWRRRVDPLVTSDLSSALQITDPASLPGSPPAGEPAVRFLASSSALIAVPLANQTTVLVTVVTVGSDLRVADVQPDLGDDGDVPSSPGATR